MGKVDLQSEILIISSCSEDYRYEEVDVPQPGPLEVLVKVLQSRNDEEREMTSISLARLRLLVSVLGTPRHTTEPPGSGETARESLAMWSHRS